MLALSLAVAAAWQALNDQELAYPSLGYSEFFRLVQAGEVGAVTLDGEQVIGDLKAPRARGNITFQRFQTLRPEPDPELLPALRAADVDVRVRRGARPFALQLLLAVVPWIVIVAAWVWLSRRAPAGRAAPSATPPGKRHRIDEPAAVAVRFEDVAGLGAAKRDLQEVVSFLKQPEKFRRLGGKAPRGVLLVGPPGTGKTLLARAVAGEAGVAFFSISGSEFMEMFVGVGAWRVRELFAEAKRAAPAIVFIDEIDAVGRARGAALAGGNDEREQTLNQLLSEMDGFERHELTVVLAATNRPDVLDAALLRPGRFDRRVLVELPELDARRAILDVHTRGKPLAREVDLDRLARDTPGSSGADLANLVNEAALAAARGDGDRIGQRDVDAAYEKIVLGDPREGKLQPEERRRVAVHESGHAIAAHFGPLSEPLRRVSILPRGAALGVTQQAPPEDRHLQTQPELESRLAVLLGGFAAERVVLGCVSSGSASDLEQATKIAFRMVAQLGMSDKIGPVFHEHAAEHPFLGRRLGVEAGTSALTVREIEDEVRQLIVSAQREAERLVRDHRAELDRLVDALLTRETLEPDALARLLGPALGSARPAPQPGVLH